MNDVIVIGAGVIGLAIAIELKLKGISVTILRKKELNIASLAAAGMLAPHAEKIPSTSLFNLCKNSLELYPQWVTKLKDITSRDVGYLPSGIIAPSFEHPTTSSNGGIWWDRQQLELVEPGLTRDIVGAWWYPQDGQVDNRLLLAALNQAAVELGVEILDNTAVLSIEEKADKVQQLITSTGPMQAQSYILAAGAYARELIDLPVSPIKGQMLAVQMPQDNFLAKVIFGDGIYLVPRSDGRLIIGATVEEVGLANYNTPSGINLLLEKAIAIYPCLKDYPIQELWWGFRPGTPDEGPILGRLDAENLLLALGHYRNGILLAPVTAKVICDLLLDVQKDPLLEEFSPHRFISKS